VTGAHLIELLRDPHVSVITTLLQKLGAAAKDAKQFRVDDDNLFVLVDESHRSQYGDPGHLPGAGHQLHVLQPAGPRLPHR
jgi:type I restriction enzyme R subunit